MGDCRDLIWRKQTFAAREPTSQVRDDLTRSTMRRLGRQQK